MPRGVTPSLTLLLAACSWSTPQPPGRVVRTVTFATDWDRSGVQSETEGWSDTTDLGYRVHLRAGWLVTYGMSVEPCVVRPTRLPSLWQVGTAFAGHGVMNTPGALEAVSLDDLAGPARQVLGTRALPDDRWCEAHILMARALPHTPMPEGVAMRQQTLRLDATWTAPDGATGTLDVTVPLANGGHTELPADVPADLRVTFVRRLDGLFDGIPLATGSPPRVARAVLANLMEQGTWQFDAAE
jgi:hypothetical protein